MEMSDIGKMTFEDETSLLRKKDFWERLGENRVLVDNIVARYLYITGELSLFNSTLLMTEEADEDIFIKVWNNIFKRHPKFVDAIIKCVINDATIPLGYLMNMFIIPTYEASFEEKGKIKCLNFHEYLLEKYIGEDRDNTAIEYKFYLKWCETCRLQPSSEFEFTTAMNYVNKAVNETIRSLSQSSPIYESKKCLELISINIKDHDEEDNESEDIDETFDWADESMTAV